MGIGRVLVGEERVNEKEVGGYKSKLRKVFFGNLKLIDKFLLSLYYFFSIVLIVVNG